MDVINVVKVWFSLVFFEKFKCRLSWIRLMSLRGLKNLAFKVIGSLPDNRAECIIDFRVNLLVKKAV